MRSYYEELVMCFKVNVFIAISHIGDTYPEDERAHARQGATTLLHTSEWAFGFPYIPIYYIFPELE